MTDNWMKEEGTEEERKAEELLLPEEGIVADALFICNQGDNGEERASQREKQGQKQV